MATSTVTDQSQSFSHPHAPAITIDLTSPSPSSLSPQFHDKCDNHRATSTHKKRKVDRACDACRRRKTKCDGPKVQDNICTNCLQAKKPCTYLEASQPRGPPKAYVTRLEDRMERLEALLEQLRPNEDFSSELGPPVVRGSWKEQHSTYTHDRQNSLLSSQSPEACSAESKVFPTMSGFSTTGRTTHLIFDPHPTKGRFYQKHQQRPFEDTDDSNSSEDSSNFDVIELGSISGLVQKLTLRRDEPVQTERPSDAHARFHGKSSSVGLVEATQRFKMMHLLDAIEDGQDTRRSASDTVPSDRRPEYWVMPPREHKWEELHMDSPQLISSVLENFPSSDLALELIDLYFLHVNPRFPLLHRPTFERQWKEKLHHTNTWFTAVCLGLFAVASRWSFDRRVLPEDSATDSGEVDWGLAGLKYFGLGSVLHEVRRSLFYPATLFEIQSFALFALYLRGTSHYPMAWFVVGIGICKLQDVGAHRRKVYDSKPTADAELWKRAFWCLVVFDRIECASLGRGCSVGQEDFDVDLPLEVDDEYWEVEDPTLNFTQPKGVPAKICIFNQVIKLSHIMAFALKTVYAVDNSKIFFGLTPVTWRRGVVEQMDFALTEWATSRPEHLAWSRQTKGSPFAADAATLQIIYHLIQILIYKAFISSPFTSSSSSEPPCPWSQSSLLPVSALDKCVEIAHTCARVSETQAIQGHLAWPTQIYAAQVCSAVLLVKIWDIKLQEKALSARGIEDIKPPIVQIIEPLMADVEVFVRVLEWAEPRWRLVGPFLRELRQSLPSVSRMLVTPLHSKNTLLLHPQISDRNVPLPLARPRQRSHSMSQPLRRSQQWEEVYSLTQLETEPLRLPTHSPLGLPLNTASLLRPRTAEQEAPSTITPRPGIPHSTFDGGRSHPIFPDDPSIPSPFEQMKSYHSGGGPAAAPILLVRHHPAQRSAPYVSEAADRSPLPPPYVTESHQYSHRHMTTANERGICCDDVNVNMALGYLDRPQNMDAHSRVARPSSETLSETHLNSRAVF